MVAIVGFQRSGTNMVRSLLATHPRLQVYDEIFNARRPEDGEEHVYKLRNFWNYMLGRAESDPEMVLPMRRPELIGDYLDALIEASAPAVPVIDIKFNSFHHGNAGWHDLTQPPRLLDLLREREVPLIHLYRRNRLKRALSVQTARKTGIYAVRKEIDTSDRHTEIDPRALLGDLVADHIEIKQVMHMLGNYPLAAQVDYEDLYRGDSREPDLTALEEALTRFGLPGPMTTEHLVRKLNSDRLQDVISNFDEVEAALRGTPFAEHLAG
ncbi:hypothetical protein ABI59_13840 [Acidobacteria bacterium Mor1]|nr:hypothetical protein ABI59_13840 [Acidobacteria bacterium Mor1]